MSVTPSWAKVIHTVGSGSLDPIAMAIFALAHEIFGGEADVRLEVRADYTRAEWFVVMVVNGSDTHASVSSSDHPAALAAEKLSLCRELFDMCARRAFGYPPHVPSLDAMAIATRTLTAYGLMSVEAREASARGELSQLIDRRHASRQGT